MVDKPIISFIARHHVLTLATVGKSNTPYCSNIFYAYDKINNRFIFTSDDDTRHATEGAENPNVAASIVLETRVIGKVQGLQIQGQMKKSDSKADKEMFLKRFPYAIAMKLNLWSIDPTQMKLTDNRLGFGKKIIWEL